MVKSDDILKGLTLGDRRLLAKAITMLENEQEGYESLLHSLDSNAKTPVIGITGPPGAGKSTLINALVSAYSKNGKSTGIIAIDPTSPFNYGSLLGDRLRMSEHFNDDKVFIRSLATRGSLGGLSAKTIEIADLMKNAGFDQVIIETVGVGQSEVEIAGLADTTVLVLVPESGDEIQTLKSGIMEIADIFVVNKSDRDGADIFANNLQVLVHERGESGWAIPVLKCSATENSGIEELIMKIYEHAPHVNTEKRAWLLTEKAWQLIVKRRMKDVSKEKLQERIKTEMKQGSFNLYRAIQKLAD